jgi:hypothetical protein
VREIPNAQLAKTSGVYTTPISRLLRKLENRFGGKTIRDIRFRVG